MDLSNNFSMRILIISSPWALFDSSLLIIFLRSSIENSTSESDLSVIKGKSDNNVLPLSINKHCFAKKDFVLFFEVSDNLLLWKSGDVEGIFLPFKIIFYRV